MVVQRRQVVTALENDVGGVLDLHEAPVVAARELGGRRAELAGEAIELAVQGLRLEAVGDLLRAGEVVDVDERVVDELEADLEPLQPRSQPVVAVHAELEAEGRPRRHAQVAEPEVGVDEVEVVVEALAAVGFEERLPGALVVPGLEGRAGLHGAEDVHETGMGAALGQDFLDPVFLAERTDLPDELDGEAVLPRHPFRVLTDGVAQGLGELGEVEDEDAAPVQLPRECLGVADGGKGARDEYAVEAREHAADMSRVAVGEHGSDPVGSFWTAPP